MLTSLVQGLPRTLGFRDGLLDLRRLEEPVSATGQSSALLTSF